MFNGDWQYATTTSDARQRRVLPLAARDRRWQAAAMSAPLTYGIAAKAKNADCAAFFLNWVAPTPRPARSTWRSAAPTPAARPTADAGRPPQARSPTRRWRPARRSAKDNGAMDFIANATGSIFAAGLDARAAEDGRRQADADGLLKAVQAEYRRNSPQ